MEPSSLGAGFNSAVGRDRGVADPQDGTRGPRSPPGALPAQRAPRPAGRRPQAPREGSSSALRCPGVLQPGKALARRPAVDVRRARSWLGRLVLSARSTGADCSQCTPTACRLRRPTPSWRPVSVASRRPSTRPVLKHGPRSLTCAQVTGSYETQGRSEGEGAGRSAEVGRRAFGAAAPPARPRRHVDGAEQERTRWDPKGGELYVSRTKSGETLMEVRSDSDVQIDRRTCV